MTKIDHFVNKFAALNRKRNLTAKELQQQAVKLWNDKYKNGTAQELTYYMDQNAPNSSDKFMLRAEKEDKKQTPKIFQFFKKTTGSSQTSSSSSSSSRSADTIDVTQDIATDLMTHSTTLPGKHSNVSNSD